MPNWLRILLVVIVAGVLGLVLVGVLAFRWVKSHAPDLQARGRQTQSEARKFAEGKQSPDCVDEGIRRAGEAKDFLGMVSSRVFAAECLKAATEPPGFCDAVPTGVIDGATWATTECGKRGKAGDQGCVGIYQTVMTHCRQRSR